MPEFVGGCSTTDLQPHEIIVDRIHGISPCSKSHLNAYGCRSEEKLSLNARRSAAKRKDFGETVSAPYPGRWSCGAALFRGHTKKYVFTLPFASRDDLTLSTMSSLLFIL